MSLSCCRTMLRPRIATIATAVALYAGLLAASNARFTVAAETWKTGIELTRQLDSGVGIEWKDNPLRSALHGLGEKTGAAVWLDRRIDPDQKIEFSTSTAGKNLPRLEVALRLLAGKLQQGYGRVGPVVYLGPEETAARLATLAELRLDEARQAPVKVRAALTTARAWKWSEATTPAELLGQIAKETGLRVVNLETLPHDVWAAGDWPAMSACERLTLLLAGFDLTFELAASGETLKLVPMPQTVTLERSYTTTDPALKLRAIQQAIPEAQIQLSGGKLLVRGAAEQHAHVERMLRGEQVARATVTPGKQVYSLKVENQPLGGVAKALAGKLHLEFSADPALSKELDQLVSFEVKNAALDELLAALAKAGGVACRHDARSLTLSKKP